MIENELDELKDAARAKELLKMARDLAEEAEQSSDDDSRQKLENRARKYLEEARRIRIQPARRTKFRGGR
jgi:hypothetical protein